MHCYKCKSELIEKTGKYEGLTKNKITFFISNLSWLECSECGEKYYPEESIRVIEIYREKAKEED